MDKLEIDIFQRERKGLGYRKITGKMVVDDKSLIITIEGKKIVDDRPTNARLLSYVVPRNGLVHTALIGADSGDIEFDIYTGKLDVKYFSNFAIPKALEEFGVDISIVKSAHDRNKKWIFAIWVIGVCMMIAAIYR